MDIVFYTNESAENVVDKNLTEVNTYSGYLRSQCSILNPIIMIEDSIIEGNYFYISEFDRYYYLTEVVSIRTGLWEVHGRVDVLQSFGDTIKQNDAVLEDTEMCGSDNYILNDVYVTKVKKKTDVMEFPNGLLNEGTFILIAAGGQGTL